MKTGVIVGRFQIPFLHKGHKKLIDYVAERSDKVIIVIGDAPVPLTDRNPLPWHFRASFISEYMREIHKDYDIFPLKDNPSDKEWSANLDTILAEYESITLYGSRDSFIPAYSGKYPVETVLFEDKFPPYNATEIRKAIGRINMFSEEERRGIIWAVENRFPVAYPTVDIAVLRPTKEGIDVLLGRKKGNKKWQFIGGFVDPQDATMEAAASRELREEAKGIFTHELEYVCSAKVEDFRYRGTKDGIMTTFFKTYILGGEPIAADDIEELCWFKLNEDTLWHVAEYHQHLFKELLKNVKSIVL